MTLADELPGRLTVLAHCEWRLAVAMENGDAEKAGRIHGFLSLVDNELHTRIAQAEAQLRRLMVSRLPDVPRRAERLETLSNVMTATDQAALDAQNALEEALGAPENLDLSDVPMMTEPGPLTRDFSRLWEIAVERAELVEFREQDLWTLEDMALRAPGYGIASGGEPDSTSAEKEIRARLSELLLVARMEAVDHHITEFGDEFDAFGTQRRFALMDEFVRTVGAEVSNDTERNWETWWVVPATAGALEAERRDAERRRQLVEHDQARTAAQRPENVEAQLMAPLVALPDEGADGGLAGRADRLHQRYGSAEPRPSVAEAFAKAVDQGRQHYREHLVDKTLRHTAAAEPATPWPDALAAVESAAKSVAQETPRAATHRPPHVSPEVVQRIGATLPTIPNVNPSSARDRAVTSGPTNRPWLGAPNQPGLGGDRSAEHHPRP